ncbi:MAG: Tetratricopeptide repeat [Acidobacteriota bacterium]|nr:Tetratricopeptide repeat [Acidobacteriota bacterium]
MEVALLNNMRRILALLACVALLLCASAARAQQAVNSLEGRVSMPNGEAPPQSVRVTLTLNGRRIYETFTDLNGHFSFGGLASGGYTLVAQSDGSSFETTSVRADVTAYGSAPQSFTQNIQLRPKPGAVVDRAGTVSIDELDPSIPSHAREEYRQGVKYAAENKAEEAAHHFEQAVREHPAFYVAQLALADEYSKLQRHDDALAAYKHASELKPERHEPYVGVGVSLVSLKRYDEGIRLLRGVVELDKTLTAPYLSLGYAEMMTGNYREAESHLLRACELNRASVAHVYLANVYEQTNEAQKAIEHLETYLKQNPKTSNAEALRAAIDKLRRKQKKP